MSADDAARPAKGSWADAEEARRDAMRDATPAERLDLLEEIVELAFRAQELNARLAPKRRKE